MYLGESHFRTKASMKQPDELNHYLQDNSTISPFMAKNETSGVSSLHIDLSCLIPEFKIETNLHK